MVGSEPQELNVSRFDRRSQLADYQALVSCVPNIADSESQRVPQVQLLPADGHLCRREAVRVVKHNSKVTVAQGARPDLRAS